MNPDTPNCPACGTSWRGEPIPEKSRHLYASADGYFSRLIGIELPYGHPKRHDGVSYWCCPDCKAQWDRFTGELINEKS